MLILLSKKGKFMDSLGQMVQVNQLCLMLFLVEYKRIMEKLNLIKSF